MLLAFDIGNTNTTMGVFNKDSIPEEIFTFRTIRNITGDELAITVLQILKENSYSHSSITGMAYSTVVPEVKRSYSVMALNYFNNTILEICYKCKLPIILNYDDLSQLGVDRIVNAVAAFKEFGASIIVDIGTAATFCVVNDKGEFDGGIIAPGIGTTIEALYKNASQLPKIQFEKPNRLVARDTVNAIKSGFYYGWISLIEGMVSRIRLHYSNDIPIVMTGGLSNVIKEELKQQADIIIDPNLTMKGIKEIFDLNS